ncbi:hypothetical protein M513_00492 [Trichuris suis]|uniref:Uncharacterized protein n=1 Tax=Trichuris suis TaxID=68888 RepID=A0A085MNK3_9BILA|nr:hypothetical protein M513_00492 [Trichuris suis]
MTHLAKCLLLSRPLKLSKSQLTAYIGAVQRCRVVREQQCKPKRQLCPETAARKMVSKKVDLGTTSQDAPARASEVRSCFCTRYAFEISTTGANEKAYALTEGSSFPG